MPWCPALPGGDSNGIRSVGTPGQRTDRAAPSARSGESHWRLPPDQSVPRCVAPGTPPTAGYGLVGPEPIRTPRWVWPAGPADRGGRIGRSRTSAYPAVGVGRPAPPTAGDRVGGPEP